LNRSDADCVYDVLHACLEKRAVTCAQDELSLGGGTRPAETVVNPLFDERTGDIFRIIGHHRFLSGMPRAIPSAMPLRPLAYARVASIQDELRRRMASELHDSTCQHLIAASLGLMRIRAIPSIPGDLKQICDEVDSSIDKALGEIRAFSYLRHPQDLTFDGLKATVEDYARGFATRTGLHVTAKIAPDVDKLPHEAQAMLLRVVQEALTNVFRHAQATEAAIVFEMVGKQCRLTISDNGRGMPEYLLPTGTKLMRLGVGIPSMRARLQKFGGRLEIDSSQNVRDCGTVLRATFEHALASGKQNRRKAIAAAARRLTRSEITGRRADDIRAPSSK
jgi:signal transduction histidine kinase